MKNSDHEISLAINLLDNNFKQFFSFVIMVVSRGMDFVEKCDKFTIVYNFKDEMRFSFWISNGE